MITNINLVRCTIAVILSTITFTSCKKFLDVGTPKVEITSDVVYADNYTATNALVSIYGDMMSSQNFLSLYNCWYLGHAADELTISASSLLNKYYNNALDASVDDFWTAGYKYIYRANAVMDGVSKSASLLDSTKAELNGEALFIRAFAHFYLVNLFGDVPYVTATDYNVNNLVVREPASKVYEKIIADLLSARALLKDYYPNANNRAYDFPEMVERVRPNKAVVTAMLARVYLYTGNWAQAEAAATSIIGQTTLYSLPEDLNDVFLKNSRETIWQLMPASATSPNGYIGNNFILTYSPGISRPALSNQILNAFETGDKRKTSWIGSYSDPSGTWKYAFKYKVTGSQGGNLAPAKEYNMILRLAEQYLIRAEARANQNNISGAVSDLNMIRTRARDNSIPGALPDYLTTLSKDDCLAAILHERQVELFTEGHRWFDLKRSGKANQVLGAIKGTSWQATDLLFPIPQTQLNLNPNMAGSQNPGYN